MAESQVSSLYGAAGRRDLPVLSAVLLAARAGEPWAGRAADAPQRGLFLALLSFSVCWGGSPRGRSVDGSGARRGERRTLLAPSEQTLKVLMEAGPHLLRLAPDETAAVPAVWGLGLGHSLSSSFCWSVYP